MNLIYINCIHCCFLVSMWLSAFPFFLLFKTLFPYFERPFQGQGKIHEWQFGRLIYGFTVSQGQLLRGSENTYPVWASLIGWINKPASNAEAAGLFNLTSVPPKLYYRILVALLTGYFYKEPASLCNKCIFRNNSLILYVDRCRSTSKVISFSELPSTSLRRIHKLD